MKKIIAIALTAALMAVLLCACGCEHEWEEADCDTPKTCANCGDTEGAPLGHSWQAATCKAPKTCENCGETEGETLSHTWVDANCENAKTCSVCGETEGEALGHTWTDADCENAKTCSVCGATEGDALGHTWTDADCENAKTCSVCGTAEGEPLGHDWLDATYDAPKTCQICGITEGDPLVRTDLGMTYQTMHSQINDMMASVNPDYTTVYATTDEEGNLLYQVRNVTTGNNVDLYIFYYLVPGTDTVAGVSILSEDYVDYDTQVLAGNYLACAMLAVDPQNYATILTQLMASCTPDEDGVTEMYYTEFEGLGYMMICQANEKGDVGYVIAISSAEE